MSLTAGVKIKTFHDDVARETATQRVQKRGANVRFSANRTIRSRVNEGQLRALASVIGFQIDEVEKDFLRAN